MFTWFCPPRHDQLRVVVPDTGLILNGGGVYAPKLSSIHTVAAAVERRGGRRMKLYIPVAGTWGRKKFRNNDWFRASSSIDALLNDLGYARVDQNNDPTLPDPGFWSGDVGGLLIQQLFPWMSHDEVWREGAENLVQFFQDRSFASWLAAKRSPSSRTPTAAKSSRSRFRPCFKTTRIRPYFRRFGSLPSTCRSERGSSCSSSRAAWMRPIRMLWLPWTADGSTCSATAA